MRQYYYMVTICKHQVKDWVDEKQLSAVFRRICNTHPFDLHIVDYDTEIDPIYKQLHAHAVVHSPIPIIYKNMITSYNGFRIYYKEVGSLPGALSYLHKNEFEGHKIINTFNDPNNLSSLRRDRGREGLAPPL